MAGVRLPGRDTEQYKEVGHWELIAGKTKLTEVFVIDSAADFWWWHVYFQNANVLAVSEHGRDILVKLLAK